MRSDRRRWPQSEKVWRQFALLDLMMERMGVDQLAAARKCHGTVLAKARKTCLACPFHRECSDVLEGGGDIAGLIRSCPNAGFFKECMPGKRPV
ncbi:MAG: hypothetical protein J0H34_16910 [Rhizobiales bacterium]|nr:hypothetical protein [Hyphomicrobiales bacterium]